MSLYLASQSPRRRELLEQIGVRFQLLGVAVDESPLAGETADDYVVRMAVAKARAGAALLTERADQQPVLGADTTVVLDSEIMGKPADRQEAAAMLGRLSGRTHRVLSAVSMANRDRQVSRVSTTEVSFRPLNPELIARYWQTGEAWDKAGAYAIQGMGALFVERIVGSYSAVVGLPLEVVAILLEEFGIPYWQKSEDVSEP